MGWNQGYEIAEQLVVTLYDKGILDKELLNSVMQPFADSDLDAGGSNDLKSKDGKSFEDICCFIMEPEKYQECIERHNSGETTYPDEPDYNEFLSDLWYKTVRKIWGLW